MYFFIWGFKILVRFAFLQLFVKQIAGLYIVLTNLKSFPPYFQLEKLPQPEHDKSSVVEAFLSMFTEVNLWPFTFQEHQIRFFRCENIKWQRGSFQGHQIRFFRCENIKQKRACPLKLKQLSNPYMLKGRNLFATASRSETNIQKYIISKGVTGLAFV